MDLEKIKSYFVNDLKILKEKYGNNIGLADVKKILNDPANKSHPAYFMMKGMLDSDKLSDQNLAAIAEAFNKLS